MPAKAAVHIAPPTAVAPPTVPAPVQSKTTAALPSAAVSPEPSNTGPKSEPAAQKVAPLVPQRFGFTLRHSKFYQSVGPVKVKLLKTNLRHSNADLSVIVSGHRINRKAVPLDESLSLAPPRRNSHSITLILDGLSKDQVTGTVIESATTQR